MSFRITNSMLSVNYLRNVKRNMNNMQTLQNQLASGKEINKASDNPYVASRSMQLNAEISYNKQYDENIKDTSNWLDTTDTALSQMGNIFGRIETLLVNAGNGTYGDDEKSAIKDEIKEKVNELSQVLNTSFDGSYIFGGTKTNSKPTTVVDGKLEYADKDGNSMNVYKQSNGTITTSATTANTSYTLTASDITLLNSELNNTTSPPSDARKTEINTLISAGVGASEYKSADGTITTSATSTNTQVGLTMADVTSLKNELNNTASPPNSARKNEINNILTQATPLTQINSSLEVDITQGVKSIYNKTAVDVLEFKDKNGKSINVSDLLSNIITDLGANGSSSNLITNDLNDIQSVTTNLLQKRSEVGTMQNRMDSAQTNNEAQNYNMTDILSKTDDIDFANKTMEYAMMQTFIQLHCRLVLKYCR